MDLTFPVTVDFDDRYLGFSSAKAQSSGPKVVGEVLCGTSPREAIETLIPDSRAESSPAQSVERKLTSMLRGATIPVSHIRLARLCGTLRAFTPATRMLAAFERGPCEYRCDARGHPRSARRWSRCSPFHRS